MKAPIAYRFGAAHASVAAHEVVRQHDTECLAIMLILTAALDQPPQFDCRLPQRVVFEKNKDYVPRDGKPSFHAGPKIVYFDRVIWNFVPDSGTASAALQAGEVDWWENPQFDLVPQLRRDKSLVVAVKDRTGEIGCLRFNHLFPPFDNAAIRRGGFEMKIQKIQFIKEHLHLAR